MSGENILVVDDEPQIRRVMRSTLSSHGYVISEAMTGEEGVDAVRKKKCPSTLRLAPSMCAATMSISLQKSSMC